MASRYFFQKLMLQLIGLFLMTLGVAFSVKADLGTSPIASLPYVLSLITPLSMGLLTFLMQLSFTLIQIAILRQQFKKIELLQIPVAIVFGYFTNVTLSIVSSIEPSNYAMQWLFCLIGLVIVAFGTFLCVQSTFPMPAGGGLVKVLAQATTIDFGRMKIAFDVTLVVVSAIIALISFGELKSVREGTIFSAVFVGVCIRFFAKHIHLPTYKARP